MSPAQSLVLPDQLEWAVKTIDELFSQLKDPEDPRVVGKLGIEGYIVLTINPRAITVRERTV